MQRGSTNTYNIRAGNPEEKKSLRRPDFKGKGDI
jgi:hypothetical protein